MSRAIQRDQWLVNLGYVNFEIVSASEDASFRSYYRVIHNGKTEILMDAPPDKEDSQPFIAIAYALSAFGLHVPQILQHDLEQGFLLLSDLGKTHYLEALSEQTVERLYGDALGALVTLQVCGLSHLEKLPNYSKEKLLEEMQLFVTWYLIEHLSITLSAEQNKILQLSFDWLVHKALEQPQVWVHRDYHSRNLMVTTEQNPGIIDFQDAVVGPITYDLVSLLRDCYIEWPQTKVMDWVLGFYDLSVQSGTINKEEVAKQQFVEWFDLMGLQRHLKAIGIFSRLHYRDNKSNYMHDIPRTFSYVKQVAEAYPALHDFNHLLHELKV